MKKRRRQPRIRQRSWFNIVIAGSIAFTVLIFIIVVLISVRLIVTLVKKSSKELGDMVDEVNNAAADLTKRFQSTRRMRSVVWSRASILLSRHCRM